VILPNGVVQAVDTRLEGIESDSADHAQLILKVAQNLLLRRPAISQPGLLWVWP